MKRWRKFAALPRNDKGLLFEAAFLLLRAKVELAILPFAKVVKTHPGRARPAGAAEQIRRVGWAVETTARHSLVALTCLPQALAAWWMLQKRGHPARLLYGVSKEGETGFSAHAWVEVGGVPVVGGRAARGFTVLTSFPPKDPNSRVDSFP
jgi:hypothetical protein